MNKVTKGWVSGQVKEQETKSAVSDKIFLMREKPKPHNVGAQDKSPLLSDLDRKEAKDLEAVQEVLNTWCHICISFRLSPAEPRDKNYNRQIASREVSHSTVLLRNPLFTENVPVCPGPEQNPTPTKTEHTLSLKLWSLQIMTKSTDKGF